MCVSVSVCVCVRVFVCVYVSVCVHVCVYACVYACVRACLRARSPPSRITERQRDKLKCFGVHLRTFGNKYPREDKTLTELFNGMIDKEDEQPFLQWLMVQITEVLNRTNVFCLSGVPDNRHGALYWHCFWHGHFSGGW